MQSWADSFLFLRPRSDSFISLKSNLWKKKRRLHSYTYGCFLKSGAEVVQFLSIKMSIHTMYFYLCLNFYLKKGEGEIFGNHYFLSGDQKFILDRQLAPVLKKFILDPGILQCYLPVLLIKANVWFRFACWWPLRVTMRASCSICHTQTFFWKNKCVSLLSDYNFYIVSSPRISRSKPFPVPCHYYDLNYYYNGTKRSKSFLVTFPD